MINLSGRMDGEINENQSTYTLGKHWAAVRDKKVVGLISMTTPHDVDYENYRNKAKECLELLGTVIAGEIIENGTQQYFVKRLTHSNRSKTQRKNSLYEISNNKRPL